MYGFLISINYFVIFHTQGIFDQIYDDLSAIHVREELSKSLLAPLAIGIWFFLYSLTAPTNHSDVGFMFYYPIYFRTSYQSLFCLGSWQWIYTLIWVGK